MSEWQWDSRYTAHVTPSGAAWLASASTFPRSVQALWAARPTAPSVLPCGTTFDVVNLPALFGRQVLEELWATGPCSGPVAVQRGRMLLLVAPGSTHRLRALLEWEEWGYLVPPLLCHGDGDAVTVPALHTAGTDTGGGKGSGTGDHRYASRWLVAPDSRHPWLPGADVMLWACIRAARAAAGEADPETEQVTAPSPA